MFARTVSVTVFAVVPNAKVFRVSLRCSVAGVTQQMSAVRLLPPSDCFKTFVSVLLRYDTYFSL